MTVVGLGNLVGGAVVVGLAYAVSASRDRAPQMVDAVELPAEGPEAASATALV